ncbi:class I SAM-dependent methyltransferase [soil metagenome]
MAADTAIDETKLNEFLGKVVGDLGAAANAPLMLLGDELGLYKALAAAGPLSSADLARQTGTAERYVREWLAAQAASGYVDYDADADRFAMTTEQAIVLAGVFESLYAMMVDQPKIRAAFRTGEGVAWHEHDPCLFSGTERFFRSLYQTHLARSGCPPSTARLASWSGGDGGRRGRGHGASTIIMAKAFPNSTFVGFDYHDGSIERATEAAREAGVQGSVRFEVAPAKYYPGTGYDLVTFFDCLHDMGDPTGAAQHVLQTLDAEGTWMIVEPFAGDTLAENLNPVGRLFYAASTMLCTPASLRARRSGWVSERRPGKPGSATSSPRAVSRGSGERPRPPSTSSSRPDLSGHASHRRHPRSTNRERAPTRVGAPSLPDERFYQVCGNACPARR